MSSVNQAEKEFLQIANIASLLWAFSSPFVLPIFDADRLGDDSESIEDESGLSPAGWAFSIWFIIYALIILFAVYQALPADRVPNRPDDLIFNRIGPVFMFNLLISSLWYTF